jgi:threonine/homoserine/homoserine lactone efflux protein
MILIIILGILLGFLTCIPIGPINLWVVKTKFKRGFWPAMSIAIGGGLGDFFYFFVILSGLSLFDFSETTSSILKTIGISFLLLMGIKELFFTKISSFEKSAIDEKVKVSNYFFLGILIYISNPTLVFSLSTLCAFLKSFNLFPSSLLNNLIFSSSVGIGSILWSYTLLKLVNKFENKLTQALMLKINRISGGLIIILSFYLGIKTFLIGK